MRDYCELC